MKSKFIKTILNQKFESFLNSIKDENVRTLVKANSIITGGAIVSMLLDEDINDYDIYFTNKETVKAVCEYYCNIFNKRNKNLENHLGKKVTAWVLDGENVELWKNNGKKLTEFTKGYNSDITYEEHSSGSRCVSNMIPNTTKERIKIMINSDGIAEDGQNETIIDDSTSVDMYKVLEESDSIPKEVVETFYAKTKDKRQDKYKPIFLTTNAITLSDNIQLIIRFYGDSDKIHENFDFIHCRCYWEPNLNELILTKDALESILNKQLIYNGSKYPFCSIVRSRKFIKRGWDIDAGQYLKMAFQLSQFDLTNVDILEDQLVGVDTVYFKQVIDILRQEQDKNSNFILDNSYVGTIVDKVLN